MRLRFIILLLCIMTEPILAHAQEPTGTIKPADPISVTARTSTQVTVTVANAIDPTMPTIYPDPLPSNNLAQIARYLRFTHVSAKKAAKVVNSDELVPEDTAKEAK